MSNEVLHSLVAALEERTSVALLTITAAEDQYGHLTGRHCLIYASPDRAPVGELKLGQLDGQALRQAREALYARTHRQFVLEDERGRVTVFVDVQAEPPHLVIVGAGHIAVPLAQIAKINDFEVTVLDDRPQYAHPVRFPTADNVIAGAFREELAGLRERGKLDHHTYIVLVTRGHQYDVDSLLEVLDDPLAYIGMIGSRRRVRAVFELLEQEQGIPASSFDGIAAPIGIDIGAQTPAEIAVCIMAEIINVLRTGPASGLSAQIRQERQTRRERVRDTAHTAS